MNLPVLEHWYAALREPTGVCLRVVGPMDKAKAVLYKSRADSDDPQLKTLSLVQSPTAPDELWIVHRTENNGPQTDDSRPSSSDIELDASEL